MKTPNDEQDTRARTVTRRDFVKSVSMGAALVSPVGAMACRTVSREGAAGTSAASAASAASGWAMVPEILARIVPPKFAARDFDITRYGAVGDGSADCSDAFRKAIAECSAAGGGRVLVPSGRFLTGPLHLRSNVNLHVVKGGTIAFSQDHAKYLPAVLTRWEGVELMNYSPFIYALDQENIAISGEGTLDGQAGCAHWWNWNSKKGDECGGKGDVIQKTARDRLFRMAEDGVPVARRTFGEGDYLRPQFIQPYRCRNVLIEGVTIVNSPMWEIHPVLCTNVTVRRVTIVSHGPNNDGCDPESCRDVLIDECSFDTGDDCIAIKSGRNADGRRLAAPSENIIVRGCRMKDGHGGVTVGSEISGNVRNVFVERCTMDSPNLDRALRLKTNAMRGGVLEHIYMRDCTIGEVGDSILSIDFTYEEGAKGSFMPTVRDIEMRNVTSRKSKYALYLSGFEQAPITNVRLADCTFANVAKENLLEHVRGLSVRNVSINGQKLNLTQRG